MRIRGVFLHTLRVVEGVCHLTPEWGVPTYDFENILAKTAWKWKNLDRRRRVPGGPPRMHHCNFIANSGRSRISPEEGAPTPKVDVKSYYLANFPPKTT